MARINFSVLSFIWNSGCHVIHTIRYNYSFHFISIQNSRGKKIHSIKRIKSKMKQRQCIIQSCLPEDIAFKIISFLEESEVCALGCCSRFWRNLCGSDCIWESLSKQRWPLLNNESSSVQNSGPTSEGWRGFYMNRHIEILNGAADVVKHVEQCTRSDSLEVGDYLQAIEDLSTMHLGFKDVQMFLFKPKLNVLLNLVGLHYCIFRLNVPPEYVAEALKSRKISDRQVRVKWWKLGRWFYGFRMRDEYHSRWVSLADLVTKKEEEVLGVLHRGAIHEVLRVQISFVISLDTPWFSRGTLGQG